MSTSPGRQPSDLLGFFDRLDQLVAASTIVVDRPRGQPHPRFPDVIYPLDYGHLAATSSGDGEGIDVFLGSTAGVGVCGVLLTADLVKRDVEIKVLIDCTEEEVTRTQRLLHDQLQIGGHLVRRP
ncbi:inorganic pyrophosphatase [Crossiella sp. CA198]|uniref:inorganic pyrophosphatase n=1 Tax=Crossiella sp. CA198 TaxID=3455607 RepID=UPI003F8D848B